MRAKLSIAIGLCLSLTAEAEAQAPAAADDMAYCAQLSALYRRYLGNTGEGRTFPDVAAAKMELFTSLRLMDVTGQPTIGPHPWHTRTRLAVLVRLR